MQKIKTFLLPVILILAVGGLLFSSFWTKRVPSNPDGTLGNTAGNLINNGLFCESEGKVYFANPYDESTLYSMNPDDCHYLCTYNTHTGSKSLFWQHRIWNPIYHGEYIYFMDMETNYELHRYNPYTGEEEVLTTDRVDTYNVYGDMIYYQKSSQTEPALMRMRTDGSQLEAVAEGVYENINITSSYVYFNEYDEPVPVYRQSTYDTVFVSQFTP